MAIVEEVTKETSPLEKVTEKRKEGNDLFANSHYKEAIVKYMEALSLCPEDANSEKSMVWSNVSAAHIKMEKWQDAVDAATQAIEVGAANEKPLERRAHAYKMLKKYDEAIEDLKTIQEKFPSRKDVDQKIANMELEKRAEAENLKKEVLGKLKDLGDMCLRPFGLSTDSFELTDNGQGGMTVSIKKTD